LAELRVAITAVFVEDMIGLNIFSTNVVALQRSKAAFARLPVVL
jgi:hypothetical protein